MVVFTKNLGAQQTSCPLHYSHWGLFVSRPQYLLSAVQHPLWLFCLPLYGCTDLFLFRSLWASSAAEWAGGCSSNLSGTVSMLWVHLSNISAAAVKHILLVNGVSLCGYDVLTILYYCLTNLTADLFSFFCLHWNPKLHQKCAFKVEGVALMLLIVASMPVVVPSVVTWSSHPAPTARAGID